MKWLETCAEGDRERVEIIRLALASHPSFVNWLFKSDSAEMFAGQDTVLAKAGAFSSGEQILIGFACDVWFGHKPTCCVFDICRRLDGENFKNVMSAMIRWRKL